MTELQYSSGIELWPGFQNNNNNTLDSATQCITFRLTLSPSPSLSWANCAVSYLTNFSFSWCWTQSFKDARRTPCHWFQLRTGTLKQPGALLRDCLPSLLLLFFSSCLSLFPATPSLPFATLQKEEDILIFSFMLLRSKLRYIFFMILTSGERVLLLKDCKVNFINSEPIFCNYILL